MIFGMRGGKPKNPLDSEVLGTFNFTDYGLSYATAAEVMRVSFYMFVFKIEADQPQSKSCRVTMRIRSQQINSLITFSLRRMKHWRKCTSEEKSSWEFLQICVLDESLPKKYCPVAKYILWCARLPARTFVMPGGEAGVKVGYFLPPLPSSLPCHLSTSLSQVQYFAVIITENVTLPFEYRREAKSKRRLIKRRECRSDTSPSAFLWRTCRDQSLAHNTTESRSSWPNILLQSLAQDSQYAVLPRFHINRLPDNWNWNKKIMCSLGDAIDSCWCG